MPLYRYACEDGHEFTELREIAKRDESISCPICGKRGSRVFSANVALDFVEWTGIAKMKLAGSDQNIFYKKFDWNPPPEIVKRHLKGVPVIK